MIEKASIIYDYIKDKPNVFTYMTLQPRQLIVEKNILGLGLKLKGKGTKNCQIMLPNLEENLNLNLILSHYANQMCHVFIPEGCIAVYLRNHFAHKKLNPIGSPIEIAGCFDACKMFEHVLRNEHMMDYEMNPKRMIERVKFFEKKGFLKRSADKKTVEIINEEFMFTLNYVGNLIQALIDTYLIVLMTIYQISGKNLVLKEKTLIKEMHNGIKELYQIKVVPFLHSCL